VKFTLKSKEDEKKKKREGRGRECLIFKQTTNGTKEIGFQIQIKNNNKKKPSLFYCYILDFVQKQNPHKFHSPPPQKKIKTKVKKN
jgi:hypothetical protein